MNSKWKINKVGLIDFWYYDEEEFHFLDGRMLLRGANGSGKSVTMQSFIPLLLDGNMRPERLDPFGSRARKMENYLLEEDSGQDERTAYLYMEFKRWDNDTWMTVGIGMRARRNKKLDSWYFCITDGRRIGKDFFLYKDVSSKVALTKQELKNRIDEGGKVMDTQREYAECVNRLIFGFETMEEYREMLELLIQLRTPKLSKDFKPTIINDILGSSLQTLSEEDLRPMSEAIENMDGLKSNLDAMRDSLRAARQIERVYDQYNQIVLYDKALLFTREAGEYRKGQKQSAQYHDSLQTAREKLDSEQEHYQQLDQEESVMAEEKKSLDDSDAAKLKVREQELSDEIREHTKQVAEKERQRDDKASKRLDIEREKRDQEETNQQAWKTVADTLNQMGDLLTDIPFDEFEFFRQELCGSPEEACNFSAHSGLLQDYTGKVETGVKTLQKECQVQERYDQYLRQMDELQKERELAEREIRQYSMLLQETKSELIESIYKWQRQNQELKVPEERMQALSRMIDQYRFGADYADIKEPIRMHLNEKDDLIRHEISLAEKEKSLILDELAASKEELHQWEAEKDPEPERSEAVKANRAFLKKKGIPYLELYRTVDFHPELGAEQADRLEEALLNMGLLDALIVPAQYREQIFALDKGLCDRYIFSDVPQIKKSLLKVLDVDNWENDLFFCQNVSTALGAIGCGNEESSEAAPGTFVDAEGNYRIGVLEGTVAKEYQARYIGARAREKYRKNKIQELTQICGALSRQEAAAEEALRSLNERRQILQEEWGKFPSGDDLRTAAADHADKEHALKRAGGQIEKLQGTLDLERKQLEEVRLEVQEACAKVYLTIRLDVFEQALSDLREYKEFLTQVQINHEKYRGGIRMAARWEEQITGIDADLDDILYDLGRAERKCKEAQQMKRSVEEQLALTDYEQIRERLDICIRRLSALPREKEESVSRSTSLEKEIENLQEKSQENETQLEKIAQRKDFFHRAFEEEYKLNYVERLFVITEEMEDQADKVCTMLAGKFGSRKQSDLLGSVQEAYHQNRAYLQEYHLTMRTLFGEMDEGTSFLDIGMKRIDIASKYRGTSLSFKGLIEKLEDDIEEQTQLLNDKDRELFEDILANTISKKIRARIHASKRWVERMNQLMESMQTSSGLKLSLRWKSKRADNEEQLDTRALVDLLQKDVEIMREDEVERMSRHFRSKIDEARKLSDDSATSQSFHMIMREVLDYRKWFEFQLECQKTGEKKKELTDRVFFTFSGGEKAMSMYVPLFSAVVAKYAGARSDAPRLISLDEAFAGVDEMNIKDMFRLMVEFEFDFMINSQILWGDYETVPSIAIYQLVRPENAKYVTVIPYVWNGNVRTLVKEIGDDLE